MNDRKDFEQAHVFHLGMGGNRKLGRGRACNCAENILILTLYEHDVLDLRIYNHAIEVYKVRNKSMLNEQPKNYRHKIAFGAVFHREISIQRAIEHMEARNRGLTPCSKKKWKR